MASHGHRVAHLEASDFANVYIGDRYYGQDPETSERLRILTWLDPPASGAPLRHRCEPGTNLWFLESELFAAWHTGSQRFLLLHGIVGCGKTTLLTSIAQKCERLRKPEQHLTAFYFSSTLNGRIDLNSFLRFLIAQFCGPAALPVPLTKLYGRHNRSFPPSRPSDEDLKELVPALLCQSQQIPQSGNQYSIFDKFWLLVDGLDEIRDREVRRDVMSYLNELAMLPESKHRILATSRPEADILRSLRLDRGWTAHAIPKASVRADIERYVESELNRHEELGDLDPDIREELLLRLAGPEQVMFRWASLQLTRLLDAQLLLRPEISHILASLPPSLNKTYDQILREIPASLQSSASTALRWLVLCVRPMFIEELIDACAITLDADYDDIARRRLRPIDLLGLLPNLISIDPPLPTSRGWTPEGNRHVITLAHFSVKEYLLDLRMDAAVRSTFGVEPVKGHRSIACACVVYLYCTNTMARSYDFWPLRDYAWSFWAIHCKSTNAADSSAIETDAIDLSNTVAAWSSLNVLQNRVHLSQFPDLVDTFAQLPSLLEPAVILSALGQPLFAWEWKETCADSDLYTELRPGEMRLLGILPATHACAPIRCYLFRSSVNSIGNYEAVSYTWGEHEYRKAAWVNGRSLPINHNLSRLLRELRTPDRIRRLWVDFVCIDQRNISERASQIQILPQIFLQSYRVAIYLGECSDLNACALDLLDCADDILRTTSNAEQRRELASILSRQPDRTAFAVIGTLFEKPWWSRIWVVQEAVMASEALLIYGKNTLELSNLGRLMNQLPDLVAVLQRAGCDADLAYVATSPAWQKAMHLVFTRELFRSNRHVDVAQLIFSTRYHRCVDSRDRFYSLVAMMQWTHVDPVVDYSKTVSQTTILFFVAAIREQGNLDLFSCISHSEDESRDLNLPSWTSLCTWDEGRNHATPLLEPARGTSPDFEACNAVCTARFEWPESLHIDGWLAGLLENASHDLQVMQAFRDAGYNLYTAERQLFFTECGRQCLAPMDSHPGDKVFLLTGGKTPYVLRAEGEERYSFIGECLVLGIMHGEYFTETDRSASSRRITLI